MLNLLFAVFNNRFRQNLINYVVVFDAFPRASQINSKCKPMVKT